MEGKVLVIPKQSPPRAVHGGTREGVKTIKEFTFDLQRFDGTTHTVPSGGDLASVISSANSGDTIKLDADISANTYIYITKNLTLDLNGHTLTTSDANYAIYVGGSNITLTVQDSSQNGKITSSSGSTYGGIGVIQGAKAVLKSGSIENFAYYGVNLQNENSSFEMTGGTINMTSEYGTGIWAEDGVAEGYASYVNTSGKITISDGSIISSKYYAIYTGCKNEVTMSGGSLSGLVGVNVTGSSKFTMSNGSITATNGTGVILGDSKAGSKDSFTMNGGEIKGKNGVTMYNGGESFTMTGGTIEATTFGLTNNGTPGYEDTTINISGGTLKAGDTGMAIYQAGGSSTTISNGTISGATGVEVRAGSIEVTGGEISSTANEYKSVANGGGTTTTDAGIAIAQHTTATAIDVDIKGGTISGQVGVSVTNPNELTANTNAIKLDVTGGTIKGADTGGASLFYQDTRSTVGISGGTFEGKVVNAYTANNASGKNTITLGGDSATKADISNLTVTASSNTKFKSETDVPEGYVATKGTDNYYTLTAVAKIGETSYYTLADAIKAAGTTVDSTTIGNEITLLVDITLGSQITIDKDITLNLNGKKINTNLGDAIQVTGGTFTLKDGETSTTSAGEISSTAGNVIHVSGGGKFVMTSGIVSSTVTNTYAVRIEGADSTTTDNAMTFSMTGGTIKGAYGALRLANGANVEITDNAVIEAENSANDAYGIVIGGKSKLTVGTENGKDNPVIKAHCTNTDTDNKGAVAISGNGSDDTDWKKTTITINSGTITAIGEGCKGSSVGIYHPQFDSKLNIKGGTITGSDTGVEIRSGTLNVEGGTIQAGKYTTVEGETTPAFKVTDTKYKCNPNGDGTTTWGAGIAVAQHTTKQNIEVNIKGNAEVTGQVALAVANPQGNTENSTIKVNVSGGTFNSELDTAIDAQNTDDRALINITGGTFNNELVTKLREGGSASAALGYNISGNSATFATFNYKRVCSQ